MNSQPIVRHTFWWRLPRDAPEIARCHHGSGLMSISLPKERKERSRASRGPLRVVDDFDAAWNAHDEEGLLDLFTDDAVARLVPALPGEPDAYVGKEQLMDFVRRHIRGFHVESRDHQV